MLKHPFLTSVLASFFILTPLSIAAASATPGAEPFFSDLPAAGPLSDSDQLELKRLLIQDCGSCHGLRMTGGLGPALTPAALNPMPRSSLIATVLYGRPGTAMPPWRAILNEDQAAWIIDQLLEGLTAP